MAAVIAVLSIVLSCLCLPTASVSAGVELDPSSILLTNQNIGASMAINQLAIIRLLSDPPATGQAELQQYQNETQAAIEALEARINQYEIQLNQAGVAANACRSEVQAVTAALEAKIQQVIENIQNITDRLEVPQESQEVIQEATTTLLAQMNQDAIQLAQIRQEVLQESQGEIQEATTTLPAQMNQTVIQFPQSYNTWNDIGTSSCSGHKELRGSSGILELTSDMYTNNRNCEWEVVAPEGSVLDIQWLSFDLENGSTCRSDWVKVVDLYRPNELIYGQKLCGSPDFLNSWITSGNKLKVIFKSDGSGNFNGFKLRFQALQISYGFNNTFNDIGTSNCSGIKELIGSSGMLELTSDMYTNNLDCGWQVRAPEGSVLAIQWLRFHTESTHDWVKVVDLNRPTELIYGTKLSGSLGSFRTSSWMVKSNLMEVIFHSDGSVIRDGFELWFQALQIPYNFQAEVPQQSQGEIQDPTLPAQIDQTVIQSLQSDNTLDYFETSSCSGHKVLRASSGILELTSDMYTNNKNCEWEVVAPEGSVLDIEWLGFHLEDSPTCRSDWVKVMDLYRPNELIYGQKLCGSPDFLNTSSWITSGNKLKVIFQSDGSGNFNGFKLRFQALQISDGFNNTLIDIGTSNCSGITELVGSSGMLKLSSNMYTNNLDCGWQVRAPEGSVLAIQWLWFDTHRNDYAKIVDLSRPNEQIYGTRLRGSDGLFNPGSWMVSSNLMEVTFHSDGSVTKDGFKLRFQALQIPYSSPQQTSQVIHNDTVPSTCSGNKVLTGTWGQVALTSYTNNKDCSWLVVTPPGTVITLRWLQFSVEEHGSCSYDWVKVTDLTRPPTLVYGKKLCGTSEFLFSRVWMVASNRILIAFHSDFSNFGQGFRLEYQALQVPTKD